MSLLSSSGGPAAQQPEKERDALRKAIHYFWYVIAAAALVIAAMFVYRWEQSREAAQEASEKARRLAAADAELMGGNRFDILQFYAYPAIIRPGDSTSLCYGVSNAKDVKIDPPVAAMWPSLMRCITLNPKKNTDYTLTIADAAGHTKTQTISVSVQK